MSDLRRKVLGVIGIGAIWSAAWSLLFAVLAVATGIVDPDSIDPGEGPVRISGFGLILGFASGVGFGIALALAENRRSIRDLSLGRVALWGIAGSAALPLLTTMNKSFLLIGCPIGAMCALVSVAIARRLESERASAHGVRSAFSRVLLDPLRAACGSH